jgi:hypothetical protein
LTSLIDIGSDILYTATSFYYFELMRYVSYAIIFMPTLIFYFYDSWYFSNSLMRRHLRNIIDLYFVKPYMEFFWIEGDSIYGGIFKTIN